MQEINIQIIEALIKKCIGDKKFILEPINKGVVSKVYEIKTQNNNYIIRYNTASESRYELEKWALETVSKVKVTVPNVLFTGTEKIDETNNLNYVIQEKLQGIALSDDFPPSIDAILVQAGKYLRNIHSIKTNRFGHMTPRKEGIVRTWPEFLFHHFKSSHSDFLDSAGFLPSQEINQISDIIISKLSSLNIKDGKMLHGDFSLDHIFYKDEQITGIIDFENVASGDPLYDIATFEFYNETNYPDKDFTTALLVGYGIKSSAEVKNLIDYYKLVIGFAKIANRIRDGKQNTVPRVREILRLSLAKLTS